MSEAQVQDALGMADDAFSELNLNTAFNDNDETEEGEAESKEEEASISKEDTEAEGTPEGGDEGEGDKEQEVENQEEEEQTATESEKEESDDTEQEGEEDPNADSETDDEEKADDSEEDNSEKDSLDSEEIKVAKSFFDKVTAPFKANGRQMQIEDADDVIRLMQMGANYNKKMAGLKPALKMVKMLERNKLLDEDRLNFLIDLDKKDPTAIAKFLKDSDRRGSKV